MPEWASGPLTVFTKDAVLKMAKSRMMRETEAPIKVSKPRVEKCEGQSGSHHMLVACWWL